MLSQVLLRILVACLVFAMSAQQWRDPPGSPALAVARNATGALRPGDVLRLTCTATNMYDYTTLYWTRRQGHVQEPLYPRGRSPLEQLVPVSAALHGAQYFCTAPYMNHDPSYKNNAYVMYTIRSDRVTVKVEGGNATVVPDRAGSVELTPFVNATSHRAGERAYFTCAVRGLHHVVLDVVLAKGNTEIQLHTGYQPARSLGLRLSRAEHGARLYCVATTFGRGFNDLYQLVSNRLPINVH